MAIRAPLERSKGYDPVPFDVPPLFQTPPRPLAMVRWLITRYLWPQSLAWIVIGIVVWSFFTPSSARMASLQLDWIALIYVRNVALLILIIGGLHLRLHITRVQEKRYKYEDRWLATDRKSFLFANQTRDNMFWTLVSGAGIAALYESLMHWLYANERLSEVAWADAPLAVAALTFAVFWIEGVHFYVNHRLLHWDPLYKLAHGLHHKNVNTGPWSGIAMHPVEHVLYFSTPLVFLIIPGNGFLVTFTLVYLMISPAPSHSGFDRFELPGGANLHGGDYFHNLHHRYFECNYGMLLLPLDKWLGTFHDGSAEAHEVMKHRRRAVPS